MRRIPISRRLLPLSAAVASLAIGGGAAVGRPPDDPRVTAVAAADDARIAAMVAADQKSLADLLSEELHYAHSNGTVDTKDTFVDLIKSGRTKYLAYRPIERAFAFPADGIAVATGRAAVTVENAAGRSDMTLAYLAVWRKEANNWRFLAWQSTRLSVGSPAKDTSRTRLPALEGPVQPDTPAPETTK